MTNFDKLNLEITTDGSLTALDALREAASILEDHFRTLKDFAIENAAKSETVHRKPKKEAASKKNDKPEV